ncbi:lipid II:glycine glycyltransferase FemX [Candidatus Chloroploca asiatica]|uniref:lipid II:glycine glycyltransferase FemX n=1 Tax=Candidatus Chloroploca asiatica TaxID=1506545 RepID=UPI000BEA0BE7|nr:peptidoglycan bridge formation glycyltransferase FemA/FemB family protein [Candidatus Chloroploca asiatica]
MITPPLRTPGPQQRQALALLEPDPSVWDAFVKQHPQGSLLQQHNWGQLKASFGWRMQRLAVVGTDGALKAGALVLFRSRYGLSIGYTPRGPLWSGDSAIDHLLLKGLERVARRARAVFLRLEPNLTEHDPAAAQWHTWFLRQGLQPVPTIQPRSSLHVALTCSEEALRAACSKGHRADIRRAQRNGVEVRLGGEADLSAFFALMQATGARAQFSVHSADYYSTAWRLFQPDALLLVAAVDGEPVAAQMVFADPTTGYYLYSGGNSVGMKSGANHLLTWHALNWARERGCAWYDLWGIPDAFGQMINAPDETSRVALEEAAQDDPLIGVYRFKKGFGGSIARYLPAYDRVLLPPLYRLVRQRIG